MRLSAEEARIIGHQARAVYGEDAEVRLFGSRADDAKRGGDIDLHLEVAPGRATLDREATYLMRLHDALGEQKIDLVLHERDRPPGPIDEIAHATGVLL